MPVVMTCSTARRLMTGRAPGSPRHTGQTWVFGGAPSKSAEHAQNILLAVRGRQWTSIPMTGSHRSRIASRPCAAPAIVIGAPSRRDGGGRDEEQAVERDDQPANRDRDPTGEQPDAGTLVKRLRGLDRGSRRVAFVGERSERL